MGTFTRSVFQYVAAPISKVSDITGVVDDIRRWFQPCAMRITQGAMDSQFLPNSRSERQMITATGTGSLGSPVPTCPTTRSRREEWCRRAPEA